MLVAYEGKISILQELWAMQFLSTLLAIAWDLPFYQKGFEQLYLMIYRIATG